MSRRRQQSECRADEGNWDTNDETPAQIERLPSGTGAPSSLFAATVQGVEKAVINAMIAIKTMTGVDYRAYSALPHAELQDILRGHNLPVEARQ